MRSAVKRIGPSSLCESSVRWTARLDGSSSEATCEVERRGHHDNGDTPDEWPRIPCWHVDNISLHAIARKAQTEVGQEYDESQPGADSQDDHDGSAAPDNLCSGDEGSGEGGDGCRR